ncbi:MAG: 2-phospho-L-lactate guanylyltransferase [Caulobacterales bacterium]|nr:2-phospho-L-lactate guanylyltransferase [Caulobacterales bacterium]
MKADVVIAVRGGPQAKTRLARRLDAPQRDALVETMLADMLAALFGCPSVRRIYVTTPTPTLARIAARFGAVVVLEPDAGGLNQAFDRTRARIAAADPRTKVMLLPGDLPRLDPAEVRTLIAAAGPDRLVVAPASADGGTGALVFEAGTPLRLAFGPGSFGKHLAAARTLGLEAKVIHAESLGFDLDRPADLDAFLAVGGGARTAHLLRNWRAAA